MNSNAILINTAHSVVVDEAAFVDVLDSGLVAGAGVDVFEDEPRFHEGLVGNEKVMLLPHMGTWTKETQTQMEEWFISHAEGAGREGVLKSPIPEQAGFWGK